MREVRSQPLGRQRTVALAVAAVVIAADQATKAWALDALADGPIRIIGDAVRFQLTRNSGAAFGILEGAGSWLALLAIIVVGVVLVMLRADATRLTVASLGLVVGGAVGNLIDRLLRGDGIADGLVVDFIDIGAWPNFNVADSAIVSGIILILWESTTTSSRSSRTS